LDLLYPRGGLFLIQVTDRRLWTTPYRCDSNRGKKSPLEWVTDITPSNGLESVSSPLMPKHENEKTKRAGRQKFIFLSCLKEKAGAECGASVLPKEGK